MSIETRMPQLPQAEESAMCIAAGSVEGKTASIRERCQNIYTPSDFWKLLTKLE